MAVTQEETEAPEPSPLTNDSAAPEVQEATSLPSQIRTEAAGLLEGEPRAAAAVATAAAAEGREPRSRAAAGVEGRPLERPPPLPLPYGGERGGEGIFRKQGTRSLSLYVGQQVRIHLVDLLRSRLVAIPPSSLACMSRFFKQMYAEEVESDAQLAQLFAQHCSSKRNPSFRPCRRIRGALTALYSSKQEGTRLSEFEASHCGVELCFEVAVTVPRGAPSPPPPSAAAAAVSETKTFTLFRRWPLRDFLELRRHYKVHHHVDLFLGRSKSFRETEGGGTEEGPLSAVERFRSLHPHLLAEKEASLSSDPFLLNGSVVAHLETAPTPTPAPAAAAAAAAATAGEGGKEGEAGAAAVKKRGRPRKYPRLEYTGAPVVGPSQVQLRPVGAPEGPYGIPVKELGVHTSISDCIDTEEAEGQHNEVGGGGRPPEGGGAHELARASRARRARESPINWKQRLGEFMCFSLFDQSTFVLETGNAAWQWQRAFFLFFVPHMFLYFRSVSQPVPFCCAAEEASFESLRAEWPHGPRVLRVGNRSSTAHARSPKCAGSKTSDSHHQKKEHPSTPSGATPASAAAAPAAAAEGRQEPLFQLSCLDQQQQQQQQQVEDVVLLSPQSVSTSPSSGVLASPCMHPPPPEKSPPPRLQDLLKPYYRRCIELLFADLLQCLRSLSYKEGEVEERVAAVHKCLDLASSPLVELPCLEALITHFGRCVKNRSSLSELDRQTQQGLVEDVLYLSRFLSGETAAAASGKGGLPMDHPSPVDQDQWTTAQCTTKNTIPPKT
ncbi:hypothetical protein Esti_002622 [Eimeria stiedai]